MTIESLEQLRSLCLDLPLGFPAFSKSALSRQGQLTKPPGSLGRLEELAVFLAHWQGRSNPRLDKVQILVFAGNHGVVAQGVSPYPAVVTKQMVANFAVGGAAINQIAAIAGAELRVVELDLDRPTADLTEGPAMSESEFLAAVSTGFGAVERETDLLCLGEMGIGNTTAAAAIAAALYGGGGARWAGRGTGVDDDGLARKRAAIDAAVARHGKLDPLGVAAACGGRELAANLGAILAARRNHVPVVLDGFVATAAAAPLASIRAGALDHAVAGHVSAEAGHKQLLAELDLTPLLDLQMRLGEASGAAAAIPLLRIAVACHNGMATFDQAGVSDKPKTDASEKDRRIS
jgi:nicotinate-nucleotide--dimethylbenzimidazole phosphoribosyltransferase